MRLIVGSGRVLTYQLLERVLLDWGKRLMRTALRRLDGVHARIFIVIIFVIREAERKAHG